MVNDDRLIIEGKIPMKKLEIHLTRVLSVIWLNIQKKKNYSTGEVIHLYSVSLNVTKYFTG